MTVDIEVNGRRFRATVTSRSTDAAAVRVVLQPLDDDAPVVERVVDVRRTPAGVSLLEVPGGRVVDAAVTWTAPDQVLLQQAGVDLDVSINGRRAGRQDAAPGEAGEQRVCAPMPGRVLRVLAEAGAAVVAGQALLVIEAMKMENALTSVRDGVVEEVTVVEGASVEAGRLLMRVV